jgi:hypothetical protein
MEANKKPLTKRAFERLLKKAAQPLPKKKSVPKEIKTEDNRPSDDCSGKYKNQGKTEGKEG